MGAEVKFCPFRDGISAELPENGGGEAIVGGAFEGYYRFRRDLQVKIGTLLKLDNVSFLIAAGCSLGAGGITLSSIPYEIERGLLDKGVRNGEAESRLKLFYTAIQAVSRAEVDKADGTRRAFLERLSGTNLEVSERASKLKDQQVPKGAADSITSIALHSYLFPLNFECFLSTLYGWRFALSSGVQDISLRETTGHVSAELLKQLLETLKIGLVQACNLPKKGLAAKSHENLLRKIMTRPENLRRAKLFTLNYDTLLEKAADAAGVILLDGFVGSLRRVFQPESFDYDFYFPGSTTEGRVHRLDRVAHLYKLHGSLNWHREDPSPKNPYGIYSDSSPDPKADAVIYPTPIKQELATGIPYSEMFRRLAYAVIQPQSVLFTIGYGFGDDHVNALVRQALLVPSFRLVIVDPNLQSQFAKNLIALGDPRVWLITGCSPEDPIDGHPLGFGTFEGFVENVLPDLADEDMRQKIIRTFQSLAEHPAGDGLHD